MIASRPYMHYTRFTDFHHLPPFAAGLNVVEPTVGPKSKGQWGGNEVKQMGYLLASEEDCAEVTPVDESAVSSHHSAGYTGIEDDPAFRVGLGLVEVFGAVVYFGGTAAGKEFGARSV